MTTRVGGEESRKRGLDELSVLNVAFFCDHVGRRDRSILSRTDTVTRSFTT